MTTDLFKEKFGYEIDGVWFPRVTSITSLATGFSFLKKGDLFGRQLGLQQAAVWGTMVHETVGRILRGEEEFYDARIRVSIETFQRWRTNYPLTIENPPENIEKRVLDSNQGYAGTIDIIAEVEGALSIIDLKTSTSIAKEYGLQTAAYMNAYNTMQALEGEAWRACEKRWILRIDQYAECLGCEAKVRSKYGRERIAGGNEYCNHQWGCVKGEIEFQELKGYERDLGKFFDLKERWEWLNKEWLLKIPNYEKNIRQYSLI